MKSLHEVYIAYLYVLIVLAYVAYKTPREEDTEIRFYGVVNGLFAGAVSIVSIELILSSVLNISHPSPSDFDFFSRLMMVICPILVFYICKKLTTEKTMIFSIVFLICAIPISLVGGIAYWLITG